MLWQHLHRLAGMSPDEPWSGPAHSYSRVYPDRGVQVILVGYWFPITEKKEVWTEKITVGYKGHIVSEFYRLLSKKDGKRAILDQAKDLDCDGADFLKRAQAGTLPKASKTRKQLSEVYTKLKEQAA